MPRRKFFVTDVISSSSCGVRLITFFSCSTVVILFSTCQCQSFHCSSVTSFQSSMSLKFLLSAIFMSPLIYIYMSYTLWPAGETPAAGS